MVNFLWITSQFISQMLYNKLEQATGPEQSVADTLKDLFAGFRKLDIDHTTPKHFWNALNKQLNNLSATLDSRSIAVVLETVEEHRVMASHGLERAKLQAPAEAHLISSTVKEFTGPEHLALTGQSFPECFLTSYVLKNYPCVNMVIFDKARLGNDRFLHFLVYFDPTVPRRNHLFLHEKEQVLSLFLRETANSFLHTEHVEQLRKDLKAENALLQDVVHQINQPLQGILADCDNLISEKFSKERKETIMKYLPYRAKHLARDAKLVQYAAQEGLLHSSRHEPTNINLSKLLIETAIEYQGYGEDKSVHIDVDTDASDSLGEILVDRDNLAMALTNVVYNAVKYAFFRDRDHNTS